MVDAARAIRDAIARRRIRNRIIKAADGFEALTTQLKEAYTRAWDERLQDGIAAALDRLADMGPGAFTEADAARIMEELQTRCGGQAMQAALRGPVISATEALFTIGVLDGMSGVDIAFGLADADALAVLADSNLFWIGEHWNSYTHERFNRILTEYFETGLTRVDLAARMAEDFAALGPRSAHYWNLMADHAATKTREIGRVAGYERAGIEYVEIRAHIDNRTTEICKALHGKIIRVKTMRKQADSYLSAIKDMNGPAAKKAWPMYTDADVEKLTGKKIARVGSPPYHFLCRTITVAHFQEI